MRVFPLLLGFVCVMLGGAALLTTDPMYHSLGGIPFILIGIAAFVYALLAKKTN